jgi:hypothetical protein
MIVFFTWSINKQYPAKNDADLIRTTKIEYKLLPKKYYGWL